MNRIISSLALLPLLLLSSIPAEAQALKLGRVKLCMNSQSGQIKLRKRCRAQEILVDAAALSALQTTVVGAQGPQGTTGQTGLQGPQGVTGQTKYVEHVFRDFSPFGTQDHYYPCPVGQGAVAYKCEDDQSLTDVDFTLTGLVAGWSVRCSYFSSSSDTLNDVRLTTTVICAEL